MATNYDVNIIPAKTAALERETERVKQEIARRRQGISFEYPIAVDDDVSIDIVPTTSSSNDVVQADVTREGGNDKPKLPVFRRGTFRPVRRVSDR